MNEGGPRGPHLIIALGAQKEDEEVFTERGVTFVIEKALFERVDPIRIGYTHSTLGSGYTLESPSFLYNSLVQEVCENHKMTVN